MNPDLRAFLFFTLAMVCSTAAYVFHAQGKELSACVCIVATVTAMREVMRSGKSSTR